MLQDNELVLRQRMEWSLEHNEYLHQGIEWNDRFNTTEWNNCFNTREWNGTIALTKQKGTEQLFYHNGMQQSQTASEWKLDAIWTGTGH